MTTRAKTTRVKLICMDFDGVIHSYTSGWKGADVIPDPPVPGVISWMANLIDGDYFEELDEPVKADPTVGDPLGESETYQRRHLFELCIFSSRSHQPGGIEAMRNWLLAHAAMELGAREGMELVQQITFSATKPPAHVTIDDRGWHFDGTLPTLEQLAKFKPWNKR